MNIFGTNLNLCIFGPPKNDIVLFDEGNSHYITNYVLKDIQTFTYNTRNPNFYFNFSIIFYFIKTLSDFNFNIIQKRKNLRAIIRELLCHYHLACLQYINPKIIITFTDNSLYYHWLCKKYKGANLFAIQNGNRTNKQLHSNVKQYHQHFFCFGNYEKDKYLKYGHKIQYSYPLGSLLGGYYKYVNRNKIDLTKSFDIGIISQFNNAMISREGLFDPIFLNSIHVMHTYCARYIIEKKIKAVILLRKSKNDFNEIEYLKKYYKNSVTYRFNDRSKFSTYKGMEQSDVVISFFSTSSIESFGWGKKILNCDFTGTKEYNDYNPMIMFTENNYDAFEMRLDMLRSEPSEEYKNRTKDYSSYLMNNNPSFPPHLYIKDKIEEYL